MPMSGEEPATVDEVEGVDVGVEDLSVIEDARDAGEGCERGYVGCRWIWLYSSRVEGEDGFAV
jgi:hypothetical protein